MMQTSVRCSAARPFTAIHPGTRPPRCIGVRASDNPFDGPGTSSQAPAAKPEVSDAEKEMAIEALERRSRQVGQGPELATISRPSSAQRTRRACAVEAGVCHTYTQPHPALSSLSSALPDRSKCRRRGGRFPSVGKQRSNPRTMARQGPTHLGQKANCCPQAGTRCLCRRRCEVTMLGRQDQMLQRTPCWPCAAEPRWLRTRLSTSVPAPGYVISCNCAGDGAIHGTKRGAVLGQQGMRVKHSHPPVAISVQCSTSGLPIGLRASILSLTWGDTSCFCRVCPHIPCPRGPASQ